MTLSIAQSYPSELLSIIFSLALPSDARHVHSRKHSPINVSQACSSWRSSALETSPLWTHLALYIHHTLHKDIWHLWLARSKNQTLRFTISQIDSDPAMQDLVRIMVDNVDRWRDIHVEVWYPMAIIVTDFPRTLESLHCCGFTAIYPSSSIKSYSKMFDEYRNWEYTCTNECRTAVAVIFYPVPIRDLSYTPMLVRRLNSDSPDDTTDEYVVDVYERQPWEIEREQFEEHSTLPALHHLSIEGSWHRVGFSGDSVNIENLICRCRISPVTLSLVRVHMNTRELCSVLQRCFRLTDLELVMAQFTDIDLSIIFDFLDVPHDTSRIVCPVLQTLRVDKGESFNRRLFVNMVVSRWRYAKSNGMGLSVSVLYNLTYDFTEGQREELESCSAEGLVLRLHDMWNDFD